MTESGAVGQSAGDEFPDFLHEQARYVFVCEVGDRLPGSQRLFLNLNPSPSRPARAHEHGRRG